MVVGAVIGVACLLAVAVLLGHGEKQWKSFDEYLVGRGTSARGLRDLP